MESKNCATNRSLHLGYDTVIGNCCVNAENHDTFGWEISCGCYTGLIWVSPFTWGDCLKVRHNSIAIHTIHEQGVLSTTNSKFEVILTENLNDVSNSYPRFRRKLKFYCVLSVCNRLIMSIFTNVNDFNKKPNNFTLQPINFNTSLLGNFIFYKWLWIITPVIPRPVFLFFSLFFMLTIFQGFLSLGVVPSI